MYDTPKLRQANLQSPKRFSLGVPDASHALTVASTSLRVLRLKRRVNFHPEFAFFEAPGPSCLPDLGRIPQQSGGGDIRTWGHHD